MGRIAEKQGISIRKGYFASGESILVLGSAERLFVDLAFCSCMRRRRSCWLYFCFVDFSIITSWIFVILISRCTHWSQLQIARLQKVPSGRIKLEFTILRNLSGIVLILFTRYTIQGTLIYRILYYSNYNDGRAEW